MPRVSRITVMDPRSAQEQRTVEGELRVQRYDLVVHIIVEGISPMLYVNPRGQPYGEPFIAKMLCGARAKLNMNSRSRFTEQPLTCITCLAGGFPDEH